MLDVFSFKDLEDGSCMVCEHRQDINSLLDDNIDWQSVKGIMTFKTRKEADDYIMKIVIERTAL